MRSFQSLLYGLAAILVFCAPLLAEIEQIPVVRLSADTEVAATPEQVWNFMTSGKNLVTWCPYWKTPDNAKISITSVGDVLDFTDDWGNGGRSVITFLNAPTELRVAHEPTNGSYICQARLILEATESGTKVLYIEQYTDESTPEELESTAATMETAMRQTLETLRSGIEAQ